MKNPRRPMGLVPHLSMHREPSMPTAPKVEVFSPLMLTYTDHHPEELFRMTPDGRFTIRGKLVSDEEGLAWLKAWAKAESASFLAEHPDYKDPVDRPAAGPTP